MQSRSPPPLMHPRPSHPSMPPPEPPSTPSAHSSTYSPASQRVSIDQSRASFEAGRKSGEGYMRFSSPPVNPAGSGGGFGMGGMPIGGQQGGNGLGLNHGGSAGQQQQGFYNPNPGMSSFGSAMPPQQPGHASYPQVPMNSMMGGAGGGSGQWGMGMNDATAQMGMQFGRSAMMAGQEYVEKNFTRYLPVNLMKTSFSVTNAYVLRKLRLVLFPWRHHPWARKVRRRGMDGHGADAASGDANGGGQEGWMPPRDDLNAPDLYIPTMALVTYTLLSALASGLQSRFHPEVLGYSLSKSLGVVLIEFLAIRLGCYLLDVRGSGASGVELVGYGGYKFVGIIVTILASFLNLGKMFNGFVFFYCFCANAFFLLRSLKYVLLPDPSASPANVAVSHTITHAQRSRRVQFLFLVAVFQVLFMGVLVRV